MSLSTFPPTSPGSSSRRIAKLLLSTGVLFAIVVALFLQRKHALFVLDDLLFIVDDPNMHVAQITTDGIARMLRGVHPEAAYRPLSMTSFMIDWWRGAGNPEVFYRTNIVLHAVNSAFVFLLARKVFIVAGTMHDTKATGVAFVAAALWAVHPIHMNAVAYIWQRSTEMAAMGVLAALIFYLYGRTARSAVGAAILYFAGTACWILACISKENAVIAPALLALVEAGVMRNRSPALFATTAEKAAIGIFTFAATLLAVSIFMDAGPIAHWLHRGYLDWDFSLSQRLLTQPRVIFFYLSQLVWPMPSRFAIEHDIQISENLFNPSSTLLALGALALWIVIALVLLSRNGKRLYGALLLFPLVALVIESSVVPLDMIFEHRMYLPSLTLFIFGAAVLFRLPKTFAWGAAPGLIGILFACNLAYLRHWDNALDIYEQASLHSPTSIRIQYNFANALSDAGRNGEAVLHYTQALSAPSPSVNRMNAINFGSIYFNQALSLLELRRTEEAKQSLELVLQFSPGHAKANDLLARLYTMERQTEEARPHLEPARHLNLTN